MSWNRIGDGFFKQSQWRGVSGDAVLHYLLIISECSIRERFDCVLPLRLALRVSDGDDPERTLWELVDAGIVVVEGDEVVVPDGEEQHMPPPANREKQRRADQRRWTEESRRRKCERGEHDRHCPAGTCPKRQAGKDAGKGVGNALPQDRTGQDKTAVKGTDFQRRTANETDCCAAPDLTPFPFNGARICRNCGQHHRVA